MTDIVDELKDGALVEDYSGDLCHRAADEIERLRKLTEWQPIETAPKQEDEGSRIFPVLFGWTGIQGAAIGYVDWLGQAWESARIFAKAKVGDSTGGETGEPSPGTGIEILERGKAIPPATGEAEGQQAGQER